MRIFGRLEGGVLLRVPHWVPNSLGTPLLSHTTNKLAKCNKI